MRCETLKYFHTERDFIEIIYSQNSKISYCEHNHKSIYTIGIIIDGDVEIQNENRKYKRSKGEVYVVKPYKSHSIKAGIEGYSILTLCIKTVFIQKYSFEQAIK